MPAAKLTTSLFAPSTTPEAMLTKLQNEIIFPVWEWTPVYTKVINQYASEGVYTIPGMTGYAVVKTGISGSIPTVAIGTTPTASADTKNL